MINFDSLTLKLFAQENIEFFKGAKIQKIQQPSRNELVFFVRSKNETKKFYINFSPNLYHLCFMSYENEQKRNLVIPKNALMFCMLLRKYILNAKIINISVPKYERIFEIYFEYYDELNEKSMLCLAIELMGKHSNVILYNYDTNVIIGCAHNVSSEKSRERELYGSLPYIYPPKQKKKNLLNVTLDSFIKNISPEKPFNSICSSYYYLTNPVVEELAGKIFPFSYEFLYDSLRTFLSSESFSYCITIDYLKYFLFDIDNSHKYKTVNEMIDNYFSFHQHKIILENLRLKIVKYISSKLDKLYILEEKQKTQINKIEKAQEYKNKADILMANLYLLNNKSDKAYLKDFEGKDIEIELSKNLTALENANKYYSLYKKIKSAYEHCLQMIEQTHSQIMYFEEQKFYAQNSDNIINLKDIYSDLTGDISSNTNENNLKIDFIEYSGVKIYIGKNRKQNDYILSKISSPEDLWFHTLNAPGAHVLIKKNSTKQEISDDILLKAAEITKEYSSQKLNSKTSVIYTKRKFVKKANNKIAFVTYKNETEIVV